MEVQTLGFYWLETKANSAVKRERELTGGIIGAQEINRGCR